MKCPCCKYEYRDAEFVTKEVIKKITRGKNKGKDKVQLTHEWVEPIGDEMFYAIQVITEASLGQNYYGSGMILDINSTHLYVCPKCGVTFKEINCE